MTTQKLDAADVGRFAGAMIVFVVCALAAAAAFSIADEVWAPQLATDAALAQVGPSDRAAATLRLVERSRHDADSGLWAAGALAGALLVVHELTRKRNSAAPPAER